MMQLTLRYRAISRVMVVTLLLVALTVVTHAVWPRLANHASGNVPQPSVHLRMEIQPRGVAQRLGGPDRGLNLVTAPQD